MIKELKYVVYLFVIFFFIFFTAKYYFSDENKKKSYRSSKNFNSKIDNYLANIMVLESDTDNIIDYVENSKNQNKKKYHFLELLTDNEK